MYSVKELFATLQGEGAHAGRAAVFCRFSGCNLWSGRAEDRATAVCQFCDTDFVGTDGEGGGKFETAPDLAAQIELAWQAAGGQSWYDLTSQAFAVFLPVKSVGVMGDGRTYEYVVALRAVQTQDFMTAHWVHLPHALLGKVSNRIINEVRGINRVVFDISGKPPSTIEWE